MTAVERPAYLMTASWLSLALALLIIWGSLYPFDFVIPDWELLVLRMHRAWSHHMSHGDIVTNILIYMPFSSVLLLSLTGRDRWTHVLEATLLGSMLSLTMELSQLFTAHRVTSIYDWLWNTTGSFAGAIMITGYLLIGDRWRFKSLMGNRPALVPMWILLLWFISQGAPYRPAMSAAQLQASIETLTQPQVWSIVGWSLAIASWLVLAESMRRIWTRPYALAALLALISVTLLGRLWIIEQHVRLEEVAGWVVAIASLFASRDPDSRLRTGVAAAACTAALLLAGLWPFVFATQVGEFHWIPFSGNLLLSRDYQPLFEKLFLYAALLWTLTLCLGRLGFAFVVSLILTTVIEIQQMWMPDRRSEITDPLLILGLAGLFYLGLQFQPYALGVNKPGASKV
jgi:VanZ family protein